MFELDNKEIPLLHSLSKKIKKDGKLCEKELLKNNTWKRFGHAIDGRKIILYGTGEMFEYFCKIYSHNYDIKYAVDKNALDYKIVKKNGLSVYPVKRLADEQEPYVLLITPINQIDEIFSDMIAMGVEMCFSFPVMEYRRVSVKTKLWITHFRKAYIKNYQLEWKIGVLQKQLEKSEQRMSGLQRRMDGIQQRQTERYLYLLHTNRMVNALIDQTNDDDLKKEQMRYLFTEIHKNNYVPNFEMPETFNEKILMMTLDDHSPLYTEISDKYLFKQYVADKVGEKYVVPLLGVWDTPEDIDFSMLPNQFVLKATSGGDSRKVILVKDKGALDIDEICKKLRTWNCKYENDYYYNFNWPFKNIKQRFIAEELLEIEDLPYYDFKVHCFHGEPKYIHVVSQNPHEVTHFDTDWNPQKFRHGFPLIHYDVPRPECLEEMLDLSRKLSAPFKYVRVDFYVLKDKLYLGELTLTTLGGLAPFEPVEIDYEWGKLI